MFMFGRDLAKKTQKLAAQFPVVAILGPRQSGKTTLAKQCFPHYLYQSLENPDTREFAMNDPKGFLRGHEQGIILDEIQHVPQLFSYIQTIVDTSQTPGRFILTGSQNFQLNAHISQSLAGRVSILTLLPLSIVELQRENILPATYETLLFKGGYPRIHAQQIAPIDWYPNYIQTYVERDIRQLKNVSDLFLFQKFVRLCAGRVGQIINWSDLGRDCGISYHTAQSWISLLEASYIIFLLQPYYQNFNKRLIKSPKLYFYDTGLLCSLLDISAEKYLHTHFLKGNIFESFIISELIKARYNHGQKSKFYFWRDSKGSEIDLIFEQQNLVYAGEIKSSETLSQDAFRGIHYWQTLTQALPSTCFLIYGGAENQNRTYAQVLGWKDCTRIFEE